MKHQLEDIKIGDEVFFESTASQHNHDLYWKVLSKYDHQEQIIVGLDTMGYEKERWTISIKDVLYHLPAPATGKIN